MKAKMTALFIALSLLLSMVAGSAGATNNAQNPSDYTFYVKNNLSISGGNIITYGNAVIGGTVTGIGWDMRVSEGQMYAGSVPEYTNGDIYYKQAVDQKGFLARTPYTGTIPSYNYTFQAPPSLPKRADLTVTDTVNITESGWYEKLQVTNWGTTHFSITANEGQVIHLKIDDFSLNNSVTINGTGKVILTIGKLSLSSVPAINLNGNSENVTLYLMGSSELNLKDLQGSFNMYIPSVKVNFSGNTQIQGNIYTQGQISTGGLFIVRGFVYAPNSNIDFTGNSKVYGRLVCNNASFSGTSQVILTDVYPLTGGPLANKIPTGNDDGTNTPQNTSVDINVLANDTDTDGDTLTVTNATQGANGAVAINSDKTIKYTPNNGYTGTDSFTYTISDGNGGTATATVTVTVTARFEVGNLVWVDTNANGLYDHGEAGLAGVIVNLYDENNLLTAVTTTDANGEYTFSGLETGYYSVQFNPLGLAVQYRFTVRGTIGTADNDSNANPATGQTARFELTANNDTIDAGLIVSTAPIAENDTPTTTKNTAINISVLANDTDTDGDALTVTSVTQGENGTVSINTDGTVKYTPNSGFTGTDSFTYAVSDGNGGTDTATVTVTVHAVNTAPTAHNDSPSTTKNSAVDINVLANDTDADGNALTVSSVTQGGNGTVSINTDGTVKYTPNSGFTGTDSFTYAVSDGNGGTTTATVTVTVTAPSSGGNDDYDCDQVIGNPNDPRFATSSYTIQNFAGTGIGGFNGQKGNPTPGFFPATNGELYGPRGLSVDKNGNLYIADEMNGCVRKVALGGAMTTIAGNGIENGYTPSSYQGLAYGQGMYEPMDVVVSPCGKYVFFLDTDHHIVRVIDENGKLKTLAGVLEIGSAGGYSTGDGNPLQAKLNTPQGIAIDQNSNLYIADTNNNVIRKINLKTNTITTIAGQPGLGSYSGDGGLAANATLYRPMGLAIDSQGDLLIADTFNHRIRKIDLSTGIITTVAGSGALPTNSATVDGVKDDGDASLASLYFPHDIAIDAADNLYIADSANHRIRKVFKTTNIITTIAGDGNLGNSGIGGIATSARLNWPKGIVVDGNGTVYISDTLNHTIKKLVP